MASSDIRKFSCTVCSRVTYMRRRTQKRGVQQVKLETPKYCKFCRKHTTHKETK